MTTVPSGWQWHVPSPASWSNGVTSPHVAEIQHRLQAKSRVGIYGSEGSGKTELVQQYIQQFGKNYSAIVWLECSSLSQVQSDFLALSHDLGLRTSTLETSLIQEAVLAWLYKLPLSLLVFHQCESGITLKDLRSYIPRSNVETILTSTSTMIENSFEVPAPSLSEAAAIVASPGAQQPSADASSLADVLKRSPVALHLARSFMTFSPGHNFLKMVEKIQSLPPIQATLTITLSHLQTAQPTTFKLLHLLSLLAPGLVPRALLQLWSEANDSADTLNKSLLTLNELGLITIESIPTQINTFNQALGPYVTNIRLDATILRNMRALIKSDDDTRHALALAVLEHVGALLAANCESTLAYLGAVGDVGAGGPWAWDIGQAKGDFSQSSSVWSRGEGKGNWVCLPSSLPFSRSLNVLAPHIISVTSFIQTSPVPLDRPTKPQEIRFVLGALRDGGRFATHILADFNLATQILIKGREISAAYFNVNHASYAHFLTDIAVVSLVSGDGDAALKLLDGAMNRHKTLYGANHPIIASDHLLLARAYALKKQKDKVKEYAEQAVTIDRKALGTDTAKFAESSAACARILEEIGEHELACLHYQNALDVEQHLYGENGIQAAVRAHQLGQCYETIGRSRQAAPMHGRAMQIHKNTLDGLDPRLALSHAHVGRIQTAVGKQTPAKTSLQAAADIDIDNSGEVQPLVAFRLSQLGDAFHGMGRYDDALTQYLRVFDIYRKLLGEHDNRTKDWQLKCRRLYQLIQTMNEDFARKQREEEEKARAATAAAAADKKKAGGSL